MHWACTSHDAVFSLHCRVALPRHRDLIQATTRNFHA